MSQVPGRISHRRHTKVCPSIPIPAVGLLEAGKDRISSGLLGAGIWLEQGRVQTSIDWMIDMDMPGRSIRLSWNVIDLPLLDQIDR
jgi:hypothetical protein